MTLPSRKTREKAARELAEIFDSKLFKALCEPVRIEIVKFLTAEGSSDVRTIAAHFPQHASVVSRHLALLHQAGVVRRSKQGRHVFFELDAPAMVDRMEKILGRCKTIVPLCCPAPGD
jgi:DNA-binding transcriptional ArsR family regulator